jgi:iron complex transport system substrate-binding protein
MNNIYKVILFFILFSCGNEIKNNNEKLNDKKVRIVSLDGTVTEILSLIGQEENIVGVDITSSYPKSVDSITKLGHVRSLSIEGILELNPTIIVGKNDNSQRSLSEYQVEQLKATGIETKIYRQDYSKEGTKNIIKEITNDFGYSSEKLESVFTNIDEKFNQVTYREVRPKVLFIYARTGMMMVSGINTTVHSMIELAGGENAVNEFEGFKALTTESLIKANPDVILMFVKGVESMNGIIGVLDSPGVKLTNAGKFGNIITMDGLYLTGFGPRLGDAVLELSQKLSKIKSK